MPELSWFFDRTACITKIAINRRDLSTLRARLSNIFYFKLINDSAILKNT